ncbi:Trp biosynthesis-associated membrane protein [Cellulomonas sp. KRMCY2]|uniref:Trp biosynthesis-associated membrane protein n=1 Tax=Cellulomonas sp. KRMCY2 TaxID=1304865 RepID=UPI00045E915B|nr:Trp biosynthesis-associated membrane protein [Cellulomonas sp. KRMCY2]
MTAESRPGEPARPGASARRRAVLVALVLGIGVLATGTAGWVGSTASSVVDPTIPITATGTVAAPGAGAGGLVVVAAGLALALGGTVGRRLAAAAVAGAGVLVAVSVAAVLADPQAVALSAAQEAVGVAELAGPVTVTVAPWVGLVLGVLAIAHGLRTAVVCGRWGTTSARHEAPGVGEPRRSTPAAHAESPGPGGPAMDDHDAWDALSDGRDPT